MSKHEEVLKQVDRIATEIVAPAAVKIDKSGEFPAAAIAALGEAGLLALPSMRTAAAVVERLARDCGSTAMIVCMHYCATAVIEQHGPDAIKKEIAAGRHLTTLAFSEFGSRGQFWAPVSTATRDGSHVRLDAKKSFATAAHAAHSYVWSSKPLAGAEASTLWLVPRTTPGLRAGDGFDGLGLRGNDSSPITAEGATIDAGAMLGDDGAGFGIMMGVVLPWFNVLASAVSVGLMETATARTAAHAGAAKFEHANSTVADLATVRAFIARMRIKTDCAKTLLDDTLAAIEGGRADATLRVLETKAAAGELATEVADLAMRVCGGAAFRKDVGVERVFRDARASLVMAPTTDVLYDFIGKAVCGLPLSDMEPLILGAVAYDPKVVTIWEGFQAWFARRGLAFDVVLYTNYERQVESHLRGDIHVAWNSPLAWLETQLAAAARGRHAEAIAMRDTDQDLTTLVLVRADGPASVADLAGKKVGVGAADSPQATLIPLAELPAVEVVRHDVLVGKHGDHIGGERDAARALIAGAVDAACVLDGNHLAFTRDGTLPAGAVRVLHQTAKYDHCNFTVLDHAPASVATFRELLLGMSYDDPEVRPLLDLEGLKAWRPGRVTGYAALERAVVASRYLEPWLAKVRAR